MNYWFLALILIAATAVVCGVVRRARRRDSKTHLDAGAVSQQWLAESRREEEA